MRQLDTSKYLVDTLKPYCVGAMPGLPGLFDRYLLEPGDDDNTTIAERLRDVKAIWDKSLENSRYGQLCKTLAAQHDDAELALLDPGERSRLAGAARAAEEEADRRAQAALADWKALLAEYIRKGGLTPNAQATLESIARTQHLDAAVVTDALDRAPVAEMPDVLGPDVRDGIRKALQDLARVVGEEKVGMSLYHALGLTIDADVNTIQRRYAEVDRENAQRAIGQSTTAYKTVLGMVKVYLLEGDPRAYVEGLILDVGEAMELDAARAATDNVIDPTEAESLIQAAVQRGLTADLARRLVVDLARRNDAVVQTGEAVDYVACPACNTPHPRSTAPPLCKRCGTALFVTCPTDGCPTRNDATALRCEACGTDLQRYAQAVRRLAVLPDAMEDGRVGWAASELEQITRVLGSAAVAPDLRHMIEQRVGEADARWADVERAIAERRLYTARRGLRELVRSAGDVPGPRGDRPTTRTQEVDRRLNEVDAALARARATSGDQREAALVEAVDLAHDCEEAIAALAAIPPGPPADVAAQLGPVGTVVSWAPSTTRGVQYRVRRLDVTSGEIHDVGTVDATRLEDGAAAVGAVLRYEVASVRGAAVSAGVTSDAVLVATEVQGLSVADLDGEVRLSWQAVPASARVIVTRTDERTGAETRLLGDRTGLVDRAVENGCRYAYRIAVEYNGTGGRTQTTRGHVVYGHPAAPPDGIEDLRISTVPGGVLVGFDQPPAGTVSILRCDDEPPFVCGEALDPGALESFGQALPVGSDGARDHSASGVCWYLPVTVAGGTAVAGRAVQHLALPEVANVALGESPSQLRVTWQWPSDVRVAKVLWRRDRQPLGPDEPGTESAWVRLGEYRDNGGFTIDRNGSGACFVAVVPAVRIDGELLAGTTIPKGARAAVTASSKADLRYVVRRTGLRKKRLEVEVEAPEGVTPPSLVLVARSGDLLPRAVGEGDVLARLGGGGPLTSSIDLAGRSRPLAVRLFLESGSAASSFQLFDPGADELLIR